MSRAFIKEDVDPPERSGRKRSASGLPPGAVNYMTARGAERLRRELADLRGDGAPAGAVNVERIAELERILAEVTTVEIPNDHSEKAIAFGGTVTVRDDAGKKQTYRIVGVDELDLVADAVSWISPLGKILLAAKLGDRVTLDDGRTALIVKVAYTSS